MRYDKSVDAIEMTETEAKLIEKNLGIRTMIINPSWDRYTYPEDLITQPVGLTPSFTTVAICMEGYDVLEIPEILIDVNDCEGLRVELIKCDCDGTEHNVLQINEHKDITNDYNGSLKSFKNICVPYVKLRFSYINKSSNGVIMSLDKIQIVKQYRGFDKLKNSIPKDDVLNMVREFRSKIENASDYREERLLFDKFEEELAEYYRRDID